MIIKLQSNYTQETLIITIQETGEQLPGYSKHPLTNSLKYELSKASGHYGHTIDPEMVNALDLIQACYELPSFRVLEAPVIEVPDLPEDVNS